MVVKEKIIGSTRILIDDNYLISQEEQNKVLQRIGAKRRGETDGFNEGPQEGSNEV